MLLGIVVVLSLLAAVGALLGSGIVAAVLTFVGSFLGLTVLVFLVVLLMAAVVDVDKEQKTHDRCYRWVANAVIDMVIRLVRLRIHTEGLEKIPQDGRFLLVCNHLNDIDPVVLMHCFPKSDISFVSKKENKHMFIIGPFMHRIQCQLIDRENDRQALKTILRCIQLIKEDQVSIGVFPEGYVSLDGKLRHFRGGVFKIAQKTGVPIVVCTIRNTRQALRDVLHLKSSDVTVHLLDVIPAEALQGVSTVEIAEQVYEMIIADLGEELRTDEKGMHPDLQRQRMDQ